jgi:hypothetical protein
MRDILRPTPQPNSLFGSTYSQIAFSPLDNTTVVNSRPVRTPKGPYP